MNLNDLPENFSQNITIDNDLIYTYSLNSNASYDNSLNYHISLAQPINHIKGSINYNDLYAYNYENLQAVQTANTYMFTNAILRDPLQTQALFQRLPNQYYVYSSNFSRFENRLDIHTNTNQIEISSLYNSDYFLEPVIQSDLISAFNTYQLSQQHYSSNSSHLNDFQYSQYINDNDDYFSTVHQNSIGNCNDYFISMQNNISIWNQDGTIMNNNRAVNEGSSIGTPKSTDTSTIISNYSGFKNAIHKVGVSNKEKKLISRRCPLCGETPSREYDLKRHMETHTRIRKHKCEFCIKAYTRSDTLKRHQRLHNHY